MRKSGSREGMRIAAGDGHLSKTGRELSSAGVGVGAHMSESYSATRQVAAGVLAMLEPATLARLKRNVKALNNRALFEIPEILAGIMAKAEKVENGDRVGGPRLEVYP
jgi:hypothetical protein